MRSTSTAWCIPGWFVTPFSFSCVVNTVVPGASLACLDLAGRLADQVMTK
jgi:hypothetical protein